MQKSNLLSKSPAKISCQDCSINQLCLPVSLLEAEIEHLDSIIQRHKPIHKGDTLFRAGDELVCLYALRSGSLKSYTISSEGEEQIVGFHLAGEVMGLNAIAHQTHRSFAVALETSMVCALPFDKLEELAGEIPSLRQQMMRTMSREILDDQEFLLLMNKKNADERLASFLTNLSTRYARRGRSLTRFVLPMTRSEIANYLGLTIETVSRVFARLQKAQLLRASGREVELCNLRDLQRLAGVDCDTHHPMHG